MTGLRSIGGGGWDCIGGGGVPASGLTTTGGVQVGIAPPWLMARTPRSITSLANTSPRSLSRQRARSPPSVRRSIRRTPAAPRRPTAVRAAHEQAEGRRRLSIPDGREADQPHRTRHVQVQRRAGFNLDRFGADLVEAAVDVDRDVAADVEHAGADVVNALEVVAPGVQRDPLDADVELRPGRDAAAALSFIVRASSRRPDVEQRGGFARAGRLRRRVECGPTAGDLANPRNTSLPPTRSAPPTVRKPAPVMLSLTAMSLPTQTAPATSRSAPLRNEPPMWAPVPAVHWFHDTHDPDTWLSLAIELRPLTPIEPSPDAPAPTLRKPTWVRFSHVHSA